MNKSAWQRTIRLTALLGLLGRSRTSGAQTPSPSMKLEDLKPGEFIVEVHSNYVG